MKKSAWYLYGRERKYVFLTGILAFLFLNLYLAVICASSLYGADLIYLDLLLLLFAAGVIMADYGRWKKRLFSFKREEPLSKKEGQKLFGESLYEAASQWEEEQKSQWDRQQKALEELSDYVTRWSHEAKLPLASLKLMNERNPDRILKREMQDCLVRLETLVQNVMIGSKLQRPENDIRFTKVSLSKAVKESVKNQSWYLIHDQFELKLELEADTVYSDKRWLVYLLDQLIGNAVKYKGEHPVLRFFSYEKEDHTVVLAVEDNGTGILKEDLPYIFLKGYVGKNQRNGEYRSTGMGLYFVKKMAERMNLLVHVCSEPGKGCRFELRFPALTFLLDCTGEVLDT